MEKELRILYEIQSRGFENQRILAENTGISVGLVNGLLKKLCQEGLLEKSQKRYALSQRGEESLEEAWKKRQREKLCAKESAGCVKEAVLLAAEENPAFSLPTAMLPLEGVPLLEYLIRDLQELGIQKIIVVTGFRSEIFREYFRGRKITLVENPRYLWSGTMASLRAAAEEVTGDFLVAEANQLLERAGIARVLQAVFANVVLLTSPGGSRREIYAELDEEGNLLRISRDIRQMNRVDGELVGLCKISRNLFARMLEYDREQENPLLNYEYVLENIGRLYKIPAVCEDDLQWMAVDSAEHYQRARDRMYPVIQKRNRLYKENQARELFTACMGKAYGEILDFHVCGGMTNTNFYVKTAVGAYVLRVPGAATSLMIDREIEEANSRTGEALGINVPILYFDRKRGVKITPYIAGAQTLTKQTAQWEENIRKTTALLRRLHDSQAPMENVFSVRREYEKYKREAQVARVEFYPGFWEMDAFFYRLLERLEELGENLLPCHNDLVPENFIRDHKGRMYLIDWEYSGKNDPMWDLAAHLLECEFTPQAERLFLECYFQGEISAADREKLLIYKMCQDILWSLWTSLKEKKGENFGSYGRDRLARAEKMKEEYRRDYEGKRNEKSSGNC